MALIIILSIPMLAACSKKPVYLRPPSALLDPVPRPDNLPSKPTVNDVVVKLTEYERAYSESEKKREILRDWYKENMGD